MAVWRHLPASVGCRAVLLTVCLRLPASQPSGLPRGHAAGPEALRYFFPFFFSGTMKLSSKTTMPFLSPAHSPPSSAVLPFFIFAASGGVIDAKGMRVQMKLLTDQTDIFSYGRDPAKNNIYYALSDYYHTDYLIPYYFWNYLKILFKL